MKVTCRHAVVSFCEDLTAPASRSVPIAVLTLCEIRGSLLAAACGRQLPEVDPLTRAMLADVPNLIKHQLGEITSRMPHQAGADELLVAMQKALRNSLHVSEIAAGPEIELPEHDDAELYSRFLRATIGLLDEKLTAAGIKPAGLPIKGKRDRAPSSLPPGGNVWPVAACVG